MAYQRVLSALSDPTRQMLLERLRKRPQSVGELAHRVPVSQPAVSQHLRVLREARLVTLRKDGARRIYSLDRAGLDELRAYVESFWSGVLDAYAAHTEEPRQGAIKNEKETSNDE
ncbi:MAG: winged helix-turn-helix transcriptional regulator [Gemmatimonadetes bacterium]|nr:winged helix-turn-helix transcriptional regulator [Gemmatimonadota bacterium]